MRRTSRSRRPSAAPSPPPRAIPAFVAEEKSVRKCGGAEVRKWTPSASADLRTSVPPHLRTSGPQDLRTSARLSVLSILTTALCLLIVGNATAQVRQPDETISAGEGAHILSDISTNVGADSRPMHDGSLTLGETSGG